MTVQDLIKLAPHLPLGTQVNLTFRISAGDAADTGPSASAGEESPASQAEGPLKIPAAARQYRIPQRELRRAVGTRHLPHTLKQDGRDAGAQLVSIRDLEAYADLRKAIVERREEAPADWPGPGGLR
jgi:hypothetical protein